MSHNATIPSGRCADCGHYGPVGEIGLCSQCGCQRHTGTPGGAYRGHDPETPPGAEAGLASYRDDLGHARQMLREARDAELVAKSARDTARRRAQLSPDCPKVGVFNGVRTTVAYAQAWIEEQVGDLEDAYQAAKVARQAASDHLRTLGEQGSIQQSISKSVSDSYRGQRESGW